MDFFRDYRDEPPALVFLDAIHSYSETKIDIQWALSVNAAAIAVHDYSDDWPGVIQAVDEFGGPDRQAGSLCSLRVNTQSVYAQ